METCEYPGSEARVGRVDQKESPWPSTTMEISRQLVDSGVRVLVRTVDSGWRGIQRCCENPGEGECRRPGDQQLESCRRTGKQSREPILQREDGIPPASSGNLLVL